MSGVGAPAAGAFTAPDDYAIVLGIEHYRPAFPPLRGCLNDARLFRDWLVSPAGGGLNPDDTHVNLLLSEAPGDPYDDAAWRPVRDTVMLKLHGFRRQQSETGKKIGRRLYLFCAGHGVAVPARQEDAGVLMPNADLPEPLFAIPGRKIIEAMQRDRTFDELILFMDCCREVRGTVDAQISLTTVEDPEHKAGANYLCAFANGWNASTAERVLDHPLNPNGQKMQQGLFTHALLKALQTGAAGIDVTSHTLPGLVRARYEILAGRSEQLPVFYTSQDHQQPIVFAAAAAAATVEVTVHLTDPRDGFRVFGGDAQTIVAQQEGSEKEDHIIPLKPGLYEFRPFSDEAPDRSVIAKIVDASLGTEVNLVRF